MPQLSFTEWCNEVKLHPLLGQMQHSFRSSFLCLAFWILIQEVHKYLFSRRLSSMSVWLLALADCPLTHKHVGQSLTETLFEFYLYLALSELLMSFWTLIQEGRGGQQ